MAKDVSNLITRDEQAQEMRRAKKKAFKKQNKQHNSFVIEKKKRMTIQEACNQMPIKNEKNESMLYEHRKFSIRAYDHNNDELWNENDLSPEQFMKDWKFMEFWSKKAHLGDCIEVPRNSPIKANFFFRRVF